MTIDHEDVEPSIEGVADKAHRLTRAAIASMPFGGAGVELFNSLVTPPLEKRRLRWMHEVTESINSLEKFASPESMRDLFSREDFLSTIVEASKIAISTHEQDKLDYLRDSLIHSASTNDFTYTRRFIFLRFIAELSAAHIRVLDVIARSQWSRGRDCGLEGWIPELAGDKQWFDLLWQDLIARKLVDEKEYELTTENNMNIFGGDSFITILGYEFLQFIGFEYASERLAERLRQEVDSNDA